VGFSYHALTTSPDPVERLGADRGYTARGKIEVNVGTQVLTAHEADSMVLQTNISSGIPAGRPSPKVFSTKTPTGEFRILEKYPSKHMGNGSLFAGPEDYELPGVPWTAFFTEAGHAFHGTYWHDNFGTPMSRGCINMRIEEARWLFRWVHPAHTPGAISDRGPGTRVIIRP
jgi:lipoprotein-anchoring transpeptidase ErfK/SrfK